MHRALPAAWTSTLLFGLFGLFGLWLGACSAPAQPAATTPAKPAGEPATPAEASPADEQAKQEERLAAIQFAMNQLDAGARLCWAAAAAVDGYQLAGEVAFTIEIAAPRATVTVARDNTKTPRLLECMQRLLAEYSWAPPLRGQAIQLPFKFRAPAGQSVINRSFVPAIAQGKGSVAVLLDERNTGNAAVSMFEVTLEAGATTELRTATRSEAWIFLSDDPATITDGRGKKTQLAAGDTMLVPKDGVRQISAGAGVLRAVLVVTPGGEEGSARAGALPTPLVSGSRTNAPALIFGRLADAKTYNLADGHVRLLLDPATTKRPEISVGVLLLDGVAAVPEHQHATQTELLYLIEGAGTMVVGGAKVPITSTSAVQVPPGVRHSFAASDPVHAIQIYTPAGPEQRFKAPPPAPPKP
jgi:quercetin dioxygenase-like cupin family protein